MSQLTVRQRKQGQKKRSSGWNSNTPDLGVITQTIKSLLPRFSWSWAACVPLVALIVAASGLAAHAQDPTAADVQAVLDNIWVLVAAILVIFMNAGFGMLETGFCRQKNAVNILSKNLIVFALATTSFWVVGFSFMFGAAGGGFIGLGGWFLSGDQATYGLDGGTLTVAVFFIFQAAFAGTAATIVSGAVAERIKFLDFLLFSLLLTGIAYPISGHWVWGGGMLSEIGFLERGFHDFAGSTVVHSVGGWAALVGASILGPRLGKYQADGTPGALPGHNMSIATLGCLILWIGWFGFNPGSELAADSAVPFIAVTTNLAAAAGGITATITSWTVSGKPDLSMTINGILAGLVAITAGCYVVDYWSAFLIGAIGGIIVVFSVFFFDSIKIDDPVGATSVHLVNGAWGTLAVGIFANPNNYTQGGEGIAGLLYGDVNQLIAQILGILTVGGFTVAMSFAFWLALQAISGGIRVSEEEELIGLDVSEHGMEAYSGFLKDASGVASGSSDSGE
jgi:Amt family ammonium transporter